MSVEENKRVVMQFIEYIWNNGKVYNNLYHLAFVIRDGKLDKFTEYCDYLYAWETNPLLSKPAAKS